MERQPGDVVLLNLGDVLAVLLREDQLGDAGALGGQNLLLHAAHGHHPSAEGRLARHGDALLHLAARVGRDDRGDHRDAGRGTVLRDRTLRHVDIDVVLLEHLRVDAQLLVVGHHPLVGDRSRLLHHLAQVAREAHLALAGRQHRFDVEDVAADLGPCEARHDARHAAHLVLLAEEFGHAEDLLDLPGRNLGRESLVEGDLLGAGSGDLRQILVQRADARLARIARNDPLDGLRRHRHLRLLDAVGLALLGQQVVQRDAHLLLHEVAGDVDHLHAVAQRRGDVDNVVGRGDEQHLRQVVFHVDVVVVEGGVLLRVEDLQQGARRVAVVRDCHLVHLVEDDDRIG